MSGKEGTSTSGGGAGVGADRADDDTERSSRTFNNASGQASSSNAATSTAVPPTPTTATTATTASTRPGGHVKLNASQELSLAAHDGLLSFDTGGDRGGGKGAKQQNQQSGGGGGGGEDSGSKLSSRPYAAFEKADTQVGFVASDGFHGSSGNNNDNDNDNNYNRNGLDARERLAALERMKRANEDAARRHPNDALSSAVPSSTASSEPPETESEAFEGFDRIGAAVTTTVGSVTQQLAGAAAAVTRVAADNPVVAAADAAFSPVDDFGATLRGALNALPTDRRSIERGIDRGVDAVRAAADRGGESPLGWRPGDMVPKRLRFRDDWKVGAEFGGEGAARINVLNPSQGHFKTHDVLRSYMHPTELVQYGISTEGHRLADRPLLEINDRVVAQWTAPPPPPSEAEKYATERNELPRGFDKWDEHHKKIWLDSKRAHQQELRDAETERLAALARKNEVLLKNDKRHHEVLREHATSHAKDKIESMMQGAGFSKDVYLEETEQELVGEKVPQITYTARKPGQYGGKQVKVGKKKLSRRSRHRRMMT